MNAHVFALAGALTLAAGTSVRADDPGTQESPPPTLVAITPYVQVGDVVFHRSHEDAFPKARKEGKLVVLYRMLGEMDGLT